MQPMCVEKPESMQPLFETILDYIPAPEGDPEAGTQVLISTIDYNEYVGRIGVGKVDNGIISVVKHFPGHGISRIDSHLFSNIHLYSFELAKILLFLLPISNASPV